MMIDISEAGAQLECAWPVPLGAVVPLPTENLFSTPLRLQVPFQVVHVRRIPETGRHRIHGCFVDTPSSEMAAFKAAVRRLDSKGQ